MVKVYLLVVMATFCLRSLSQKTDSLINSIVDLPAKYIAVVENKLISINAKLAKQSDRYLKKLQREEDKLKRHLQKIDSAVNASFKKSSEKYTAFVYKVKNKPDLFKVPVGEYFPYLDSLGTILNFLQKTGLEKIQKPLACLHELQSRIHLTEKINEFIAQRKEQLKQLFSTNAKLPSGIRRQYEKLSKTGHYYLAQIKEYKELLKDPAKIEQKAMAILAGLPAFQNFTKENSQLASMFRLNGSNISQPELPGLQTRTSLQNLVTQQLSRGGTNALSQVQENLSQAHIAIENIKAKINTSNNVSSPDKDADAIKGFIPNEQKTKSFLKRIEFGSNIQSQKANRFFPMTTDIGISVGYKLNDKSKIGIGISGKMGWGKGINNVDIKCQGIGLRSFIDYRVRSTFSLYGGYEQKYETTFNSIDQLMYYDKWQSSGLAGISKKYKISKKLKGNMQLMWDFLSYTIPGASPFIYRIGYILK